MVEKPVGYVNGNSSSINIFFEAFVFGEGQVSWLEAEGSLSLELDKAERHHGKGSMVLGFAVVNRGHG